MIKCFLFLFGFLFLFSCSKLETGLSLAPRIVSSRVDSAFDFKSKKLSELRSQIEKDIGAYKKDLAIKLIAQLDILLELSKKEKITADDIRPFIEAMKAIQAETIQSFKPSFEVVLKDIQESEAEYFKKHIDKKFRGDLEDAAEKKDFLADRKKSVLKTFGYFFDDISDQQKNLCKEFVERNYAYFLERIKIRKTFSENFYLKLVAKEPTLDFVMNYYAGGIKEFSSSVIKDYLEDFYKFQAEFWNITSDKERNNFRENALSYKEELKKIAGL